MESENFKINDLTDSLEHSFIRESSRWPLKLKRRILTLLCDPRPFPTQRKWILFDVQEDHKTLIEGCMNLLKRGPESALYFSCHKKGFKLDQELSKHRFKIKDISAQSIPVDFRNKKIHFLFKIQHL